MIADQFDAFLFDLDGVVYVGDEPLPEALPSITRLYEREADVRFLTNDPSSTRHSVAGRLRELGFEVRVDEIVTSAWATARYLSHQGVSTVAVVGSEGLRAELRSEGIETTNTSPEAVVIGGGTTTTYEDLQRATRHVHDGARFVGTNPDGSYPTPDGPAPAAGAIVQAVEAATDVEPTVIGKPEPHMFKMALDGIDDGKSAVMIGDTPETDILGAHRAGLTGILIGEKPPSHWSHGDFRRPDRTISTLADMFREDIDPWNLPSYPWAEEIHPGVAAVIVDGDEIALSRQATKWTVPTGTVDRFESIERALLCSVEAEIGAPVDIDRVTGIYSRPENQVVSPGSGQSAHYITTCFRCQLTDDQPTAVGPENGEVEFFDAKDLPSTLPSAQVKWISHAISGSDEPVVR